MLVISSSPGPARIAQGNSTGKYFISFHYCAIKYTCVFLGKTHFGWFVGIKVARNIRSYFQDVDEDV